jgi:hypothetical protein
MISKNDILKDCFCSLENGTHFLDKPLELTCGHSACKQCIGNKEELRCRKCQTINTNKGEFVESKANEDLIEMHVADLMLKLEERFKTSIDSFKSKIQIFKTKFDLSISYQNFF